jgi:hypothetical protein
MQSQPGDYIGQGQNYLYDATNALFSAQAYDRTGDGLGDYMTVHVRTPDYSHWWYLTFGTNQLGTNLVQGTYTGAQRAPFAGAGHPGLDVYGDGRGCNTLTGSFQVEEAVFDYSGGSPRLVRFAASFEQHCEGMAPALTGTIQFVDNRDLTPPTTTLSLSGPTGENGWYRGPVQAALVATDTGGSGGVAATYYTIDAGATATYAAPFTVAVDGNHTLSFWSVDQSGNQEPRRSQGLKIDGTAPALTASVSMDVVRTGGTTVGITTVSGRITDALSGLASGGATYSVVDEYSQVEPSGTVAVQADGSYSFTLTLEGPRSNDKDGRSYQITVRARDLAGNAGAQTVPATVPRR